MNQKIDAPVAARPLEALFSHPDVHQAGAGPVPAQGTYTDLFREPATATANAG